MAPSDALKSLWSSNTEIQATCCIMPRVDRVGAVVSLLSLEMVTDQVYYKGRLHVAERKAFVSSSHIPQINLALFAALESTSP